jgi:hypothetical protein
MEEAAAKAAQFSKDISLLLERKEQDKSRGRRECKGAAERIFGENLQRLGRSPIDRCNDWLGLSRTPAFHPFSTMTAENACDPAGPCFPPAA